MNKFHPRGTNRAPREPLLAFSCTDTESAQPMALDLFLYLASWPLKAMKIDQASGRVRRKWQRRGPAPRAWTTTTTRAARVRVGRGSVPRTGCPPDPSAPRAESGRVPPQASRAPSPPAEVAVQREAGEDGC